MDCPLTVTHAFSQQTMLAKKKLKESRKTNIEPIQKQLHHQTNINNNQMMPNNNMMNMLNMINMNKVKF